MALIAELVPISRNCLLDESLVIASSLECPTCKKPLATTASGPSASGSAAPPPGPAILTQYRNEGGLQSNLDILPNITEEAYLIGHPETRPARAFQVMCAEGDVNGMVELLADVDSSDDEGTGAASVLRYQDPLSNMRSGLHLAVQREQTEVALFLLWLRSSLPSEAFPEDARQSAHSLGVGRMPTDSSGDIRALKDGDGLTAGDYARHLGGAWQEFLGAGLL